MIGRQTEAVPEPDSAVLAYVCRPSARRLLGVGRQVAVGPAKQTRPLHRDL